MIYQFVSVVSKVLLKIFDGIFNARLKNIKKINKNVKNVENVVRIKKCKKRFFTL